MPEGELTEAGGDWEANLHTVHATTAEGPSVQEQIARLKQVILIYPSFTPSPVYPPLTSTLNAGARHAPAHPQMRLAGCAASKQVPAPCCLSRSDGAR